MAAEVSVARREPAALVAAALAALTVLANQAAAITPIHRALVVVVLAVEVQRLVEFLA